MGKLTAFVASPLRALMDLVAMRKERWTGIDWLTRGLRIEEDLLLSLKHSDFATLRPVYKHRTANAFLDPLECACESREPWRTANRQARSPVPSPGSRLTSAPPYYFNIFQIFFKPK